jgi:hypothetical protein
MSATAGSGIGALLMVNRLWLLHNAMASHKRNEFH